LFVSSSPNLVAEREAIGQAVAELPVSVGWEIKHTPRAEQEAHEALAFIARSDLCLVVLGADFAAPMGLEWRQTLGTGKLLKAYRKRELRSPSAQQVPRQSGVSWTDFESPQALKAEVSQMLAQVLLDRGEQLGLNLTDVERLLALTGQEDGEPAEPDRRRGAERGGVILRREG
jgi:hypothetical protein